ncbi:MAG: tetratricopeptide repeat protein [Algoriphagus sp.]|nr:tetratricopeptide repeat protein [Algoriphagus sp.]
MAGAIADYEKAIELDPEDAVAYNNLGLVEEKMGRKEKAQQNFTKADALSGYPPKKETEQVQGSSSTASEKKEEKAGEKTTQTPKLTLSHFFSILNGLVTEGATRKEFVAFLSGIFGKKGTKNS